MESIKPYFSIIIPVYKVEDYLKECIESVITQKFQNIEIILVDDGSPDRCPSICDEYARKDSRVSVIHKKNGGLSSARNAGIQTARGEYIIFLDSDDYWNTDDALQPIYEKTKEKIDVLVYFNIDFSCITKKAKECKQFYNEDVIQYSRKEEVLKYLFNNNLFPGAAWVTVTKREFLIKNRLFFIEGIKAEDIDWLLKVFLSAESYSVVNLAFYVYRKYRNGSITGTADAKSIDDILYTLDLWCKKMKSSQYDYIRKEIYGFLSKHYVCAVLIFDNLEKNRKKIYLKKLKQYKFLMKYSALTSVRLCYNVSIPILSKVINLIRKVKR